MAVRDIFALELSSTARYLCAQTSLQFDLWRSILHVSASAMSVRAPGNPFLTRRNVWYTWQLVAGVLLLCMVISLATFRPQNVYNLQLRAQAREYDSQELHTRKSATETTMAPIEPMKTGAIPDALMDISPTPKRSIDQQSHQPAGSPREATGTDEPVPTIDAEEGPVNITNVKIPRIIHQMWKTSTQIPSRFQPWIRSWVEKHPGWQYVFWTYEDQVALFENLYPKYLPIIRNISMVSVSDMTRYALLHQFGGLDVDLDFECLKPFDQLHHDNDAFLSSEPEPHAVLLEKTLEPAVCNAILASAPGHPFWMEVLENIYEAFNSGVGVNAPISLTGPRIVKKTYAQYSQAKNDVTLYAPEFFYPEIAYWNIGNMRSQCEARKEEPKVQEVCAWMEKFPHGEFTNNTHATHHWQCTWCLGDGEKAHLTLSEVMRVRSGSNYVVFKPEFYRDEHGTNKGRLGYFDLTQQS